jgi:hypothetical protein
MKKGKELKVEKFKNYNIVFGSVNNKNPKALYINMSAWAQPKSNGEVNYRRIIRDLDKKIRQEIYNQLDSNISTPFIKDRTIVDFDIRESGVKYGKRSFANCEITLFMKYEIPVNSDDLKPTVYELIGNVIKNVFNGNKNFRFHRKKR